ncbi:ATP-binding protein [Endozoicomonas numazuensis]|uniref:ATP-binding protein n=1 Tax=Endozoicomonas numazuensis TaxID=1137799 RepID=UPI000554BD99|nr:ATP-binding protein [Endozoicomonas numazuensis]
MHRFTPRSLPGRFFLVMVALILATQVIVNNLWETQSRNDQDQAIRDVAMNMALRVSATVEYFSSLPTRYRHVILNQLRDMGGTRYFVTLNREFIHIEPFQNTASHQIVLDVFRQTLEDNVTTHGKIQIAFSSPETLRVFNNDTLLKDLPDSWGQESLMVKPLALPVLVIQIAVGEGEWLYLATLMPDSSLMNNEQLSEPLKASYMAWMLILMFIASLLIQKMTRPFKKLSMAAQTFGRNLEPVPVSEAGCREYETTARAFNHMQKNIQHYMNDRKQLFSGISHDLKTPITRLRLRTELLDNDEERDAFNQDLNHLEMMVKSALQILSDTDIHENPEKISLKNLLDDIAQSACSVGQQVQVFTDNSPAVINGKPLAMRRCLENLIGNAVQYGQQAHVYLISVKGCIDIRIRDKGPGLPEGMEEEVFKPYFRLEHGKSCNPDGNGLGLITARHLVNIHGGYLKLRNYPEGGLEVALELPEDKH